MVSKERGAEQVQQTHNTTGTTLQSKGEGWRWGSSDGRESEAPNTSLSSMSKNYFKPLERGKKMHALRETKYS